MTSHWPFNDKTCQVFIIITLVGFALIHTMVLMAVNRFYRIVKPTKYDHYFTNRKTLLMIFALWFYSIFAPLIGLLKRSKMIFHPFKLFCFFFSIRKQCIYGLWYSSLVPTCAFVYCYLRIFKTVRHHNANFHRPGNSVSSVNVEDSGDFVIYVGC